MGGVFLQPLDLEQEPAFCPCLEVLPESVRRHGLYRPFLQVCRDCDECLVLLSDQLLAQSHCLLLRREGGCATLHLFRTLRQVSYGAINARFSWLYIGANSCTGGGGGCHPFMQLVCASGSTINASSALQGFAECFDTVAVLLAQGRVPLVSEVLSSWQSQHWSGGAKNFFLGRVRSWAVCMCMASFCGEMKYGGRSAISTSSLG